MLKSVCPTCGIAFDPPDNRAECKSCRPRDDGTRDRFIRGTRHERGYNSRWSRLSKQARKLQPFCSDCGRTDHLTADHSVEAWKRHDAGLPIRLKDIDVVCQWCNTDRGAARGIDATDEHRQRPGVEILESWLDESLDPGGMG